MNITEWLSSYVVVMACSVRLFVVPWNGVGGKGKGEGHVALHISLFSGTTTNQVIRSAVQWSGVECRAGKGEVRVVCDLASHGTTGMSDRFAAGWCIYPCALECGI